MTREREDKKSLDILQEAILIGEDGIKVLLQHMIQEVLEEEMTRFLGAESYERTVRRKGYRNGYKPRMFKTRVGTLELLVPQDREGRFFTVLFERYQRSEKALVLALQEMYLQGVSTRKVKKITEELCGIDFSKSQVSEKALKLDEEIKLWRNRRKELEYPYLVVDARYEKIRENHQVISKGVLLVMGIDKGFHRGGWEFG